jgi:hypothetical protein
LRDERRLRVFEIGVLRRIFEPKRDEVTGEWRTLHIEELNDMYCSPSTIQVFKTIRMRWAGHVEHMWERRGITGLWWGTLGKTNQLEDVGVGG